IDNPPKVELLDAADLKGIATQRTNPLMLLSVASHPDGKTLAVGTPEAVQLWEVGGKKPVASFLCTTWVRFVAFDREGKILAAAMDWPGADQTFRVWDVKSGKKLADTPL